MKDEYVEVLDGNENMESDFEGEIWKPEMVDEALIGKYVEIEENVGTNGDSTLYHIRTPDGDLYKVWGSMVLDGLFQKVALNTDIKLVYKGKKQSKKGFYYKVFKLFQKEGGEKSPSSSSLAGHDKHTMERAEQGTSDEPEILDIVHEQEKTVEIARGWLNKITNDMIGEQLTVNEKTLKVEVYRLSQIPAHDGELGYLEDEMAREVFKLIDKKG